jgi:hypothetical protein
MSEPHFPRLRRWMVTVNGYGFSTFIKPSRGKALSEAWNRDCFSHLTFGEFLKIARCHLHRPQPEGEPCTVDGRAALSFGHDNQYVHVQMEGCDHILLAHPLEVLPQSLRPVAYREQEAA